MADPPKPTPKVSMDPNFEKRLRELTEHAKKEFEERPKGERTLWYRPENFNGDVTDLDLLGEAFEREQANREGVDAIKSAKAPGVSGDTVAAITMVETLSVMERSFRLRHTMRRPRAVAHAMGRLKGHGDPKGPLSQNGIEYVRQIIVAASEPQP